MKTIAVMFVVIFLVGCANNTEMIAEAMKERQPVRCSFTDINGTIQSYEGPICDNIARAQMQVNAYHACSGLEDGAQGMCVMGVTFANSNGGQSSRTSDDAQMLIAAMNNDTRIMAAWIGQIPIVGTVASSYFHYKSQEDLYQAFEEGMGGASNFHVTQSNDGGAGGEGGSGRGGDGDLMIFTGDDAQILNKGNGSAISDGRNPMFNGLNQPSGSFTTTGAPNAQTRDDDGGQSLIPGF